MPNTTIEALQSAIIKIILYFDVFDYPLNKREIHAYLGVFCVENDLENALLSLENNKILTQKKDFYF